MADECLKEVQYTANTMEEAIQIAKDQRLYWEQYLPEEQRGQVREIRIWLAKETLKFIISILIGPLPYLVG